MSFIQVAGHALRAGIPLLATEAGATVGAGAAIFHGAPVAYAAGSGVVGNFPLIGRVLGYYAVGGLAPRAMAVGSLAGGAVGGLAGFAAAQLITSGGQYIFGKLTNYVASEQLIDVANAANNAAKKHLS